MQGIDSAEGERLRTGQVGEGSGRHFAGPARKNIHEMQDLRKGQISTTGIIKTEIMNRQGQNEMSQDGGVIGREAKSKNDRSGKKIIIKAGLAYTVHETQAAPLTLAKNFCPTTGINHDAVQRTEQEMPPEENEERAGRKIKNQTMLNPTRSLSAREGLLITAQPAGATEGIEQAGQPCSCSLLER
ncbi:hypothetical protein BGW36DRAFT_459739 [Talaromyces proteolyticus]|uniref:Uncharacterized protein n=1 Tax=Talaromyces proteolyticus TaxID=1131652 RepID=A0AAD4KYV0_9EURO|nr:uncharacterized protein BGW36DRAFT_459739 [Talaromyces proteolyticus]KAH8700586.1 hypothetical protein BGW36DRAFT_459739 [Talaromyces proteolyticus]